MDSQTELVRNLIKDCRTCGSGWTRYLTGEEIQALANVTEFVSAVNTTDSPTGTALVYVTVMDGIIPDHVIAEPLPIRPSNFRDTKLYESLFIAAFQCLVGYIEDGQKLAADLAIAYADAAYAAFERERKA